MTHTTRLYVHGTGNGQRSTARRLVAGSQQPAPHAIAQTVEIDADHDDVFESEALPDLFYIRSNFRAYRYYTYYVGECSCGKEHCRHEKIALAFKYRDQEEVA